MIDLAKDIWAFLQGPEVHGPLGVVVTIIVALVAWATGILKWLVNLFRSRPEVTAPSSASGGAVVAHKNAAVTVQQPGLTFQDHQAALKERETTIRNDLERAFEAEKDGLRKELAEAQRRIAAGETDYDETKKDLADISTDLAQIENLPPEKLKQAQTALAAGRTAVAEALLAEVEQEEEEGIERAAQAAYLRGEIAQEDIRWADAAVHYTRAANLNANYQRLQKAHEFLWRAGDANGAAASGEAMLVAVKGEYGEHSRELCIALNTYGLSLNALGKFEDAEKQFRQGIDVAIAVSGDDHNDHATSLNNLANLLRTMGRYEEAEPLYRQAIEIDKATIGEAHPDYAQRLNNLAVLLEGVERFDEVPDLYRDAVRISRASLGDDHPDVRAQYAQNFARYLRKHDATSADLADLIAVFGDDIGR